MPVARPDYQLSFDLDLPEDDSDKSHLSIEEIRLRSETARQALEGRALPWLIHVAVTSTPFGFDGKWTDVGPWRCSPFPNNKGAHCCYPFVSLTPQFIQVDRLGPVYEMPPHPYNP